MCPKEQLEQIMNFPFHNFREGYIMSRKFSFETKTVSFTQTHYDLGEDTLDEFSECFSFLSVLFPKIFSRMSLSLESDKCNAVKETA